MGLLAAFVEGASGEYLDQRKDDRTNKFQEIRDKRLSELKKGETKHEFGLRADENTVQHGRSVEMNETAHKRNVERDETNYGRETETATTEYDRQVKRDTAAAEAAEAAAVAAEERALKRPIQVQANTDVVSNEIDENTGELKKLYSNEPSPTAAHKKSLLEWDKWDKTNVTLTNGKRITTEKLYKEWLTQAYGDPAFPEAMTTVKRPGVLDWIPYHNSRVVTKDRATFGDPEEKLNDAREHMPDFANRKDEMVMRLRKKYPWWTPPEWAIGADLGAGSGEHPSGRTPGADLGAGSGEHPRGGLLSKAASAEDTSRNAGIGSGGIPSGPGEIGTRQGSGDVFSTHIQEKLTELESQLANMPERGRASAARRKQLEAQIKRQRRLLEESGGNG